MTLFLWSFDMERINKIMDKLSNPDKNYLLIEITCDNNYFDQKMKSPSDFYRKLSNGKMSLGGPNQTNRRWWERTISGGYYVFRKNDKETIILLCVELKSSNIMGCKLQFLSRIKKLLPFSCVRLGGLELLDNYVERFISYELGCQKGTQFIGNQYYLPR